MIQEFCQESNDNTFFVTGCCSNRCLMCCQPPVRKNDFDSLFQENMRILRKAPADLAVIGISGGEPTSAGNRLFSLLEGIRKKYPAAIIHFLTNGRMFSSHSYMERFIKYDFSRIIFAIPLHSDFSGDHDRITQRRGSYHETMLGLYNLASEGAKIELRIIINKINFKRLPKISDFIFYNLPFVEDIAFVGMEAIGNAVENKEVIWIDPVEYQKELEEAVLKLARWKLNVCIYNHPLCLLTPSIRRYSWNSISDWKIKYLDGCAQCSLRNHCGGLFATSKWQSPSIHPIDRQRE